MDWSSARVRCWWIVACGVPLDLAVMSLSRQHEVTLLWVLWVLREGLADGCGLRLRGLPLACFHPRDVECFWGGFLCDAL